jgi:hypothetical protein
MFVMGIANWLNYWPSISNIQYPPHPPHSGGGRKERESSIPTITAALSLENWKLSLACTITTTATITSDHDSFFYDYVKEIVLTHTLKSALKSDTLFIKIEIIILY